MNSANVGDQRSTLKWMVGIVMNALFRVTSQGTGLIGSVGVI